MTCFVTETVKFISLTGARKRDLCPGSKGTLIQLPSVVVDDSYKKCMLPVLFADRDLSPLSLTHSSTVTPLSNSEPA